MNRTCPSCGLEAASPDQTECARCGTALPLSPGGPDSATQPSTPSTDPTAPPPPPPPAAAAGSTLPSNVRNWAMAAHLSGFIIFLGIPISAIGPLVVWLIKRDAHPFIDAHGKEALNFNISILIYAVASAVLILLLVGIVLLIAVGVFWFVLTIIAAVRAANGEPYEYPLTIRFVS
jgi:uncharacterized protein